MPFHMWRFAHPVRHKLPEARWPSESEAAASLLFQPIVLVSVGAGWYVKSADATWTVDWRHGGSTVIPVSFGVGRVFVREDLPPINFFVSGEWTTYRESPVAPQTTVRFGMTIAFPDLRPWK